MKRFFKRLGYRFGDKPMIPAYALALLFVLVWLGRLNSARTLDKELLYRREEIRKLTPITEKVAQLEAGAAQVRSVMNAAQEAATLRRAVPAVLRKLRESPVKGVVLEEFSVDCGGNGSLSVSAARAAVLGDWLKSLRARETPESPGFMIVAASTVAASPPRSALLVKFKLR